MLDEVQLLVGTGRPEILTVVDQILFFLLALLVGHGDGGLFAEGRVGEDVIHTVAGIGEQGIALGYGDVAVDITDIVEVEIHQGHFEGGLDQLVTEEGLVFEKFLLFPIQRIVGGIGKVFLGGEEKAAGAAAGIIQCSIKRLDHCCDQLHCIMRGIKLTLFLRRINCKFLEEVFVNTTNEVLFLAK